MSPPPPPTLYMPSTKTIALFPDESTARENEGYYCPANLPRPGERVEVEGRTATVVANTPAAQPSFETDCTVTVEYKDGSLDTVSAAEQPTPRWVQAGELGFCAGYFALVTGGFEDSNAWPKAQKRHQEVLEELEEALAKSKETTPPTTGEYWGGSEESDGADQSVRSTIRFGSDGSISGRGNDGEDGYYTIKDGRWAPLDTLNPLKNNILKVAWKEKYDQGFEVVVEGEYNTRTGKIKAHFESSRRVSGTFELAPKPSVF